MTEPVEFDVDAPGAPNLGDQASTEGIPDPMAEAATALMPVPGWTAQEAARVVGGGIAWVTTILYVIKHQSPPAAELWPYIAGSPEQEFILTGQGLAPLLDFLAPKGSAAAVGVNLSAGGVEILAAMSRRAAVLNTPPPSKGRPAQPQPTASAAPPPSDPGGFKYSGEALRVLESAENPLVGVGVDA